MKGKIISKNKNYTQIKLKDRTYEICIHESIDKFRQQLYQAHKNNLFFEIDLGDEFIIIYPEEIESIKAV